MRTGKTACGKHDVPETDRAFNRIKILPALLIAAVIPGLLISGVSAIEFTFSGEISEISCGSNPVLNYDIEGDHLIFTESDSGTNRLRLYDFSEESFTEITDSDISDFRPGISADRVVFQKRSLNSPAQIFIYNITDGRVSAADPYLSNQGDADISENLIVWLDSRLYGYTNIFIKTPAGDTGTPLRISATSDKHSPKTDGDFVYWTESGNLYRKSVKTGDETVLLSNFPDNFEVCAGKVVYNGRGENDGSVLIYDTVSSEKTLISSGEGFCRNPDISKDYVAYECYDSEGTAVRLYDLRTENGGILMQPQRGISSPKISENRIIWTKKEGSDYSIVICRLDTETLPLAGFEAEPLSGRAPLQVKFTGMVIVSVSSNTEYLWNFGDGEISDSPAPVHTYTEPGIYSVNLTVENEMGSFTAEKKNYISVEEVPRPDFSALNREGAAPLNVKFTDESSGKINSRVWDFGDGSRSYNKDPVHVYSEPGIYSVNLTVENEFGRVSEEKADYIIAENIVFADFSYSYPKENNSERLTIRFTDNSEGYTNKWMWYFDDEEYSYEQNPVHTFAEPGVYDITLEAGNDFASNIKTIMSVPAGETDYDITAIYVSPESAGIKPGESMKFSAVATDVKGTFMNIEPEWSVSDTKTGTITQYGHFTARAPGTTRIIAEYLNRTGYAAVIVSESGKEFIETAEPDDIRRTEKLNEFISGENNLANRLKEIL